MKAKPHQANSACIFLQLVTGVHAHHSCGFTVNANYTMVALSKPGKYLKKKRPEKVEGDWFFH